MYGKLEVDRVCTPLPQFFRKDVKQMTLQPRLR